MPLTPEWGSFFAAELGALASLTGFVVVAISINLARILSYPHLPTRAGEALIGPVGAITATSVLLIPQQPAALLGSEVVAISLVMVVRRSCSRSARGAAGRTRSRVSDASRGP
jgi:hypothetical protein